MLFLRWHCFHSAGTNTPKPQSATREAWVSTRANYYLSKCVSPTPEGEVPESLDPGFYSSGGRLHMYICVCMYIHIYIYICYMHNIYIYI